MWNIVKDAKSPQELKCECMMRFFFYYYYFGKCSMFGFVSLTIVLDLCIYDSSKFEGKETTRRDHCGTHLTQIPVSETTKSSPHEVF